ncbi:putative RNA-directed DNA polymerase from transposon X-element [Trichonephila clavipes]|nr:putative RNA-directed DNA polymerase from transposon X-element [Trichonephila clavipes]
MTVESLRVKQRSLRSSFTMCCTSIEDALKRDTSLPDLYALQRQIMDKFARLDTVQEQILELLFGDETLSGEYEDDFNKAEKYRDRMNQLSAELEYAVNKSLNKPQSEAEISQGNTRKFKLPKLELTRFNGDPKDFLNFWSQFEKIHIDSNIDDDDKMHYLIQCSFPGSKMFRLVSSFPPTRETTEKRLCNKSRRHLTMVQNYVVRRQKSPRVAEQCDVNINSTQRNKSRERFGREDLLVQIYIRDLLGLVMQNATGKIRLELSKLYDVLNKLLALESLGRTQEKFTDFLEPLVESCLPEAMLRAWERCRNAETTSEGQDSGRSLDRLMTFLRKEVESEETILLARTRLGSTQRQKVKANAEEPSLATSAALVNTKGEVLSEIKEKGIIVPDLCNSVNEADMLLGADVISVILTGRSIKLRTGLMAIGTMLGFTLMGKSSQEVNDNTEVSIPAIRERQLSMFLNQLNVKELWDLETV